MTVLSSDADASILLSGEKAMSLMDPEWPSSICTVASVAALHSLTVLSPDADASSLPSGEKAIALIDAEWPSSVCMQAPQADCDFGGLCIQLGFRLLNCFPTMLFSGTKTRAEKYIWRGVYSIIDLLLRMNRFASWMNAYRLGLSSALIIG